MESIEIHDLKAKEDIMPVGNGTEEPVDYDVDDPGAGTEHRPILLGVAAVAGVGLMLYAVQSAQPWLAALGALLTVAAGIGLIRALRPRPLKVATRHVVGLNGFKKTLGPGKMEPAPVKFLDGSEVRFCRHDNHQDIARVQIGQSKAAVTLYSAGLPNGPKEMAVATPVTLVSLHQSGNGTYSVDLLSQP